MLAYAANRPSVAQRGAAPNAMLVIVALHVAAIAALMSAKMDLPEKFRGTRTIVDLIEAPKLPPEQLVERPRPDRQSMVTRSTPDVALPSTDPEILFTTPYVPSFEEILGPAVDPAPRIDPVPPPAPVKLGPRLSTPASELRPPYPRSKLASGEEAVLRLKLTVDQRGRVVAVEPVGRADSIFLEAARRHLLAHWRYRPATEDGRPVTASISITLRFELQA